jgi:hypothetical protein
MAEPIDIDALLRRAKEQREKGLTPEERRRRNDKRRKKFAEAARKQAEEAKKRARARTRKKSTFRKLIEGDISVPGG